MIQERERKKEIGKLRKQYHIFNDIALRLLKEDEMASRLSDRENIVYM